jgi:N utilization substance protein B
MHKISVKKRHQARLYAMQALYSWDVAKLSLSEIEQTFLTQQNQSKFDVAYFTSLLHSVPENVDAIDKKITMHLHDRAVDELGPIELSILRIAVYEILFLSKDVPCKVAINEAIELAKEFGAVDSHSFVNGVLDPIIKQESEVA